jgi:hypothetical protein
MDVEVQGNRTHFGMKIKLFRKGVNVLGERGEW